MPTPGRSRPVGGTGGRRGRAVGLLAVVALGFLALGLHQAWTDAPTYDEPVYLSAGVTALVHHDLRLNPEHPPLAKVVAALPVLADHPVVPGGRAWDHADEHRYATVFVHAQEQAGKLRTEMLLARLAPLLETVGVAFALWGLAGAALGPAAGLLAGLLWLADPFVLGIGHLDGVDTPLTLAAVLAAWALLVALRTPGRRQLVVLGVACGAAVLTQAEGLIICLAAGIALVAANWPSSGWRALTRQLAPVAVVAWLVVWLGYLVVAPSSVAHLSPLPEPLVTGLRYLGDHDTVGAPAYLLGQHWVGGRWWYWPASLAVKVPWSTVAALVVGPLGLRLARRTARREVVTVTVLPAVLLTTFTLLTPKDVGLRYLLPVLALWMVPASAAALPFGRATAGLATRRSEAPRPDHGQRAGEGVSSVGAVGAVTAGEGVSSVGAVTVRERAVPVATPTARGSVTGVVAAGLAVTVIVAGLAAAVLSAPDSLAWANPPFSPAYRSVSNSDVDWGQGFWLLRDWARGKHPWVAYFGQGLGPGDVPGARSLLTTVPGVAPRVVAPARAVTGWVAVSATALTSDDAAGLAWLRSYCPVRVLGGSILVYRFTAPPEDAPAPDVPLPVCPGGSSHR